MASKNKTVVRVVLKSNLNLQADSEHAELNKPE